MGRPCRRRAAGRPGGEVRAGWDKAKKESNLELGQVTMAYAEYFGAYTTAVDKAFAEAALVFPWLVL